MNFEYEFTADLEIESERQTLTQNISLEELEDDSSIFDILTLKLEEYIQNTYCSCSFNENQNHCDCDLGDYDIVDIVNRKLVA